MATTRRHRKLRRHKKNRKSQRRNKERKLSRKNNQIVGKKYVGGFIAIVSAILSVAVNIITDPSFIRSAGRIAFNRGPAANLQSLFNHLTLYVSTRGLNPNNASDNILNSIMNQSVHDCGSDFKGSLNRAQNCELFKGWFYNAMLNFVLWFEPDTNHKEKKFMQKMATRRDSHLSRIINNTYRDDLNQSTGYWFNITRNSNDNKLLYESMCTNTNDLTKSQITDDMYVTYIDNMYVVLSDKCTMPNRSDFAKVVFSSDIYSRIYLKFCLLFTLIANVNGSDEKIDIKTNRLKSFNTIIVTPNIVNANNIAFGTLNAMYATCHKYTIESFPKTSIPSIPSQTPTIEGNIPDTVEGIATFTINNTVDSTEPVDNC